MRTVQMGLALSLLAAVLALTACAAPARDATAPEPAARTDGPQGGGGGGGGY